MNTVQESEKNANTQDRRGVALKVVECRQLCPVTAKSNSLTVLKQVQVVR